MSNPLNKQILYCYVLGMSFDKIAIIAKELRYPMFCHNGDVYSTWHASDLIKQGLDYKDIHSRTKLFKENDLQP